MSTNDKPVIIEEKDILKFLDGIKSREKKDEMYNDEEKAIIIYTYEHGYVKDEVAARLHTSPKNMKRFYESYLKEKEQKK